MISRRTAWVGSLSLYGISLFFPAFDLKEGQSGFLLGFVCLLFGFERLAWYANPLYLGSLIALFFKKDPIAALLSVPAIALALTTLGIREMPRNESGTLTEVVGYGLGFYLWVSSMAAVLVASVAGWIRSRTSRQAS